MWPQPPASITGGKLLVPEGYVQTKLLENDIVFLGTTQIFIGSSRDELAKGGRVEIRGLFALTVRTYGSYTGRNPITGENVSVSPKKLPILKVGKELMKRLNKEKIDENR